MHETDLGMGGGVMLCNRKKVKTATYSIIAIMCLELNNPIIQYHKISSNSHPELLEMSVKPDINASSVCRECFRWGSHDAMCAN